MANAQLPVTAREILAALPRLPRPAPSRHTGRHGAHRERGRRARLLAEPGLRGVRQGPGARALPGVRAGAAGRVREGPRLGCPAGELRAPGVGAEPPAREVKRPRRGGGPAGPGRWQRIWRDQGVPVGRQAGDGEDSDALARRAVDPAGQAAVSRGRGREGRTVVAGQTDHPLVAGSR
ncbi:hypothetical protein KCH_67190 [Kitasatospora cheerisanensis KCTC 2395]|uniref:Uncharacterized protein n=1 Tax=Kitasatospora cheerisanensis KCTC 2395 TaxID=1348663 RepID=A0A066YTR7_9ACTN|nr:hypothetical protein KCH_67190 [Kitasatospora cheerisanensis KCTC 2395]